MREFNQYHRRISVVMFMVCVVAFVALAVLRRGDLSWALGFGLGAAAQLVKFTLVDIAVVRKIAVERKDAAATQLKGMAVWLVLFALAALAVFTWRLNVWAMVAGIFLPRLILIADTRLRPDLFSRGARTPEREAPEGEL